MEARRVAEARPPEERVTEAEAVETEAERSEVVGAAPTAVAQAEAMGNTLRKSGPRARTVRGKGGHSAGTSPARALL